MLQISYTPPSRSIQYLFVAAITNNSYFYAATHQTTYLIRYLGHERKFFEALGNDTTLYPAHLLLNLASMIQL